LFLQLKSVLFRKIQFDLFLENLLNRKIKILYIRDISNCEFLYENKY